MARNRDKELNVEICWWKLLIAIAGIIIGLVVTLSFVN